MEKRVKKELTNLSNNPPTGINLRPPTKLTECIIDVYGAPGTLFEGEQFELMFKFNQRYPFDSPAVTFIGSNIPLHPHIYSNGHICLSILDKDWSPALSVESVCLSILSMLSSCKKKERPPDDRIYVARGKTDPKQTRWYFHDDDV